jgi:subtilisin family serine protease
MPYRSILLLGFLAQSAWNQSRHGVMSLDPRLGERTLREAGIRKLEALGGREWIVALTSPAPLLGSAEPLSLKLKLSEELQNGNRPLWTQVKMRGGRDGLEILVYYHADLSADHAQAALDAMGAEVVDRADSFERLTARIFAEDLDRLAQMDWVRRIEPGFAPLKFWSNAESGKQIGADRLHSEFGLTGDGARVAVVDGLVDLHPEFGDRLRQIRAGFADFHGTHVAGTLAAAGNDPRLKGVAPAARILSYSLRTINEGLAAIQNSRSLENADLATNSWGADASEATGTCNSMGAYTAFERDVDRIAIAQRFPIVFALGNTRDQYDCSMFARAGFYTIPPPGSAKNIITVGAVDRQNALSTFSSFGPTRDGRVKPEVVALGVGVLSTGTNGSTRTLSGTSMSAPAVSGLAALLIDRFRQKMGEAPPPELLKAFIANTANDLGNPGPDYSYGYGIPDGVKAVEAIDNNRYTRESITSGSAREIEFDVPEGAPALRAMLSWTDPLAPIGAPKALMHDLDLVLIAPDGTRHLPLTLNPARAEEDAIAAENTRDNLEQAVVGSPAAGRWRAVVSAKELPGASQAFALTWTFADNPAPPCSTTIFPASVSVSELENNFAVQVARSSTCEPWSVTELPDWVEAGEASSSKASGFVKMRVRANESGSQRSSNFQIAGKAFTLRQNTHCVANEANPGESITGSLQTTDCAFLGLSSYYAKHFSFRGAAGQRAVLELASNTFDAYVVLLGPGNIYIGEDDDSGGGPTGLNSRFPASGAVALPLSGVYTVIVTSAVPRGTGPFNLRIVLTEATGSAKALPKAIESCPAAIDGELSEESSVEGRRGDLYRTDIYLFEGRVGQQIIASIAESSFDAVAYLIGPTGAQLAFSDDSGASRHPRLERVLTANGIYRLEVTSYSPFSRGAYKLNVENCANWAR